MKTQIPAWAGALIALCVATTSASLDTEAAPCPIVVTSASGRYFFKMSPDPEHPSDYDRGFGYAYAAGLRDSDHLLWRTEGWYAYELFLTNDGEHLVRMGGPYRGLEPSRNDLLVAFYEKGALLKSYAVMDLVKDASKITHSSSHYWPLESNDPSNWGVLDGDTFKLGTADRIGYVFNLKTGEIISSRPLQ